MRGKKVVLAGVGHAHLYSLARIGSFSRYDVLVDVIAPGPFNYSGMGPGILSGQYNEGDNSLDVSKMVGSRGGRLITDKVEIIDADERTLKTSGGETIKYDVLSLNIGSEVAPLADHKGQIPVFPVKPIHNFIKMRNHLLNALPGSAPRIVVAGGGPAGCEAAANALSLCLRKGYRPMIKIVTGRSGLLPGLPEKAGRIIAEWFRKNGIAVETGIRVIGSDGRFVLFGDGSRQEADMIIIATGVHPPELLEGSGFSISRDGALVVDEHLESVSHKGVFGGGDCIYFKPCPLDRVGVYAVRQGPVLFNNLIASITGRQPRLFRPQKKYLLILNLGDGTGLLSRGKVAVAGRIPLLIKNWLDRRFIRKYRPLK